MNLGTVLFDLDGTLADPFVGISTALRRALAATGVDPAAVGPLGRFIGPPLQESFAGLGLGPAAVSTAIDAYRGYYGEVGLFECTAYPGIAEALAELRHAGIVLAVATSKPWAYAEEVLAHLGLAQHFAAVAGPELDGRNRHKHEAIAVALDRLGRPGRPCGTDRTAMVGDRAHDVLGATRVGVLPIGVTWGYGDRDELAEAGAACVVDTPAQLVATLLGRRAGRGRPRPADTGAPSQGE